MDEKTEESEESEESHQTKKDDEQEIRPENEPHIPHTRLGVVEWLNLMKWHTNPFIFSIIPSLFVGYKSQREHILRAIEEQHKYALILGPTGSGKTTFLKWLESRLSDVDVIFIGKPPKKAEEFIDIFNNKYRKPWYNFWSKNITNIYQIPDFLNRRLRKRRLIIMLDEAHESELEVLEWLRVLNDQVENMSVILSGLPNLEAQLKTSLETFIKRVTAEAELLSLTKEETSELIRRRIQNVGGTGNEFSGEIITSVYDYTGGFPREVIRLCDRLVNNAMMRGKTQIEFDISGEKEEKIPLQPVSMIDRMTPMQQEILEMLSKGPLTPGQIADAIDLTKYKSRQHAVRSVNNIVKKLFEDGHLERRKEEKAFVYTLSPRLSTIFVKR